jgi:hypothetical protein
MMDEVLDAMESARVACSELELLIKRVARATRGQLANLEFDAGVSLDGVEMDPLASDAGVCMARQLHAEALAAIARRKELLGA